MLTKRIIPCLDIRGGRVVKGVRFAGLIDMGDPAEQASLYDDQGADELVLLDVSATPEGRSAALDTVCAVRQVITIPMTVGGGVRDIARAEALLSSGADKIAINTAAMEDPDLITGLSKRVGSQCVVVSVDAAVRSGGWELVTRSGTNRTGVDAVEWARRATSLGAGEVLLTSWDRDGTRAGYDSALIEAVSKVVSVPIVASGGADGPAHMVEALKAGADAVLAASIFHSGQYSIGAVKEYLKQRGVEVRS